MRNVHCHELALVSGGIVEGPSDQLRRDLDGLGQNGGFSGLQDYSAWNPSTGNTSSVSPGTAMQMIGVGALLAAFGILAVAAAPLAASAGLVGAAYSLGGVGTVAASGGGIFANYGWSLLKP